MDKKNELAAAFSLVLVLVSLSYVFRNPAVIYGFIFSVLFGFALIDKKTSPFMKIVLGLLASVFLLMIKFA